MFSFFSSKKDALSNSKLENLKTIFLELESHHPGVLEDLLALLDFCDTDLNKLRLVLKI
jgi:hypothetical protein